MPAKKVVKKKKVKKAVSPSPAVVVKPTSLEARLDSIDRRLAELPSETVRLAASPFADSVAVQLQVIRFSLARYGKQHGDAMALVIAGHVVRNLTWISGAALAGAGYANAVKQDSPSLNDYRLAVVGAGVIAGGQVIASLLDIMGMSREGAAAGELLKAMERAAIWEAPAVAPAPPEEAWLPAGVKEPKTVEPAPAPVADADKPVEPVKVKAAPKPKAPAKAAEAPKPAPEPAAPAPAPAAEQAPLEIP